MFSKIRSIPAMNKIASWALIASLLAPIPAGAQRMPTPPGARPATAASEQQAVALNFRDAPLEMVLKFYSEELDENRRTMLIPPNVRANITLRSQTRLSREDAKIAIESILSMNNITLVPMGERFIKVVQIAQARQDGMPVQMLMPEEALPETDAIISQMIELKYLTIQEAQPLVQQFLHGYGKIQPMERINGLLVTDTSQNIQRVLEVLQFIDRPILSRVETRVYEIRYAEAGQIATKLNTIITDLQEGKEDAPRVEQPSARRAPPPGPPGVIRARQPEPAPVLPGGPTSDVPEAPREIIRGKVKIIADERTNILLVISDPANFDFFDKIVDVLDRAVEPEIVVRIEALEYADAEEIAGLLNSFIGATSSERKTPGTPAPEEGDDARSRALQQYVQQRADARAADLTADDKAKIGQLSANTKILADKRTNALMLMGRRSDIAALRELIDKLDIMLAQVLIEVVILEIGLSDTLAYGVDWLQRSVTVYDRQNAGPGGGLNVQSPVYSFAGGTRVDGSGNFQDASSLVDRNMPLSAGALTYYATFFDLNLDAIVRLAATDRDARILQTPVILTTDNQEAKITVGEDRPIVTSTTTSTDTGAQTSRYEYKNIGIEVAVTPRINPERMVIMDIKQKANHVLGSQRIDGNEVPIIAKREMEAQVAVRSRSTIALGGLVQTDNDRSRSKVPILGDIPLLGALFRSDSRNKRRTELLVLITPYVLMTPEEARMETARLKNSTRAGETPWPYGWSESPLATPGPEAIAAQKRKDREERHKEEEVRRELDLQQRMEERRRRREMLMNDPFLQTLPAYQLPQDDLGGYQTPQATPSFQPADTRNYEPVVLTSPGTDGTPAPLEPVAPPPQNTRIEALPDDPDQLDRILRDLAPGQF